MNLKLIKDKLIEQRLTVTSLAEHLEMSRRGLYTAIDNETLQAAALEKIARFLKVPVSIFFDDNQSEEIDYLKKEIERLNELCKTYANQLGDMNYEYNQLKEKYDLQKRLLEENEKSKRYSEGLLYVTYVTDILHSFIFSEPILNKIKKSNPGISKMELKAKLHDELSRLNADNVVVNSVLNMERNIPSELIKNYEPPSEYKELFDLLFR